MIIKCPECGHQVSDKAPVCPSCGVEIAGKVVRCPHCGEIHFISDGICPNCHHSLTERREPSANTSQEEEEHEETTTSTANAIPVTDVLDAEEEVYEEEKAAAADDTDAKATKEEPAIIATPVEPGSDNHQNKKSDNKNDGSKQKKSRWPLIVSIIIAIGISVALLFAYNNANKNNEEREFRTAIESNDPAIMQSYLNTYVNAPEAHRDSIKAKLNALRAADPQWDRVKNSTDVNELKAYLKQNPNSSHKQQVLSMIDELDWKAALQTRDFANYLSLHQNGAHAVEAVDSVKLTMDMPASGADKQKATSTIRSFLVALNSHNADRVRSCVADNMEYFNEKSQVSGDEVLNYMAIIYKNADRLNWHIDDSSSAKVTKSGTGQSAQYSISMPARLSVNYNSGNNVQSRYNIHAKINGSGKITAIKLIRLAEEKPKSSDSDKSSEKSSDKKTEHKKSSDKKSK